MKKPLAVCLLAVLAGFILYSVAGAVNAGLFPLAPGRSVMQADNIPVPRPMTLQADNIPVPRPLTLQADNIPVPRPLSVSEFSNS
jgi:hypothetical protein